jgi:hypothetical protein
MSPAQRNGRTSSRMPHEGTWPATASLAAVARYALTRLGCPPNDNKLEARVVKLAQRLKEQGKGLAPEVPERDEDDVGVVEAEAGAYRPAVEALRPPHPVEVDRVGDDVHLGGGRRVLLEQLAGQPVPETTMRRMRPNTQGSAMAWRRWSSQRSQSRTVLRLAVSFRRNAP